MSESTNITPTAAAAPTGAAKPTTCCEGQKPAQTQPTGAPATNPAANKGFKRQGKKQH